MSKRVVIEIKGDREVTVNAQGNKVRGEYETFIKMNSPGEVHAINNELEYSERSSHRTVSVLNKISATLNAGASLTTIASPIWGYLKYLFK